VPAGSSGRDLAAACRASDVRSAVNAFVRAFNRGDGETLQRLFAKEPGFKWYSSALPGKRIGAAAQRRATLSEYFRSRHRRADTLALRSFSFHGNSAGVGHFAATMRRSARDFLNGTTIRVPAKGAAACAGGRASFVVMSLGGPQHVD
jgi:hypothetical protein